MKKFSIEVTLTDEQAKFMEWVLRSDNHYDPENPMDMNMELEVTLSSEIYRLMEKYDAEYKLGCFAEVK